MGSVESFIYIFTTDKKAKFSNTSGLLYTSGKKNLFIKYFRENRDCSKKVQRGEKFAILGCGGALENFYSYVTRIPFTV